MAIEKDRVDCILVNQGLFDSREQAKRAVMAGQILGPNQERFDKPGQKVPTSTEFFLKGEKLRYVSRGGLKLEKALAVYDLSVADRVVLDIGSSTGGFTDVCLQNGAKTVYALDVGTNQLAWKLRQDERVVVMENTNFRYSQLADFEAGQPTFATIDVSFISLRLILESLRDILALGGQVVALIKPQFEAGRDNIGKNGIVKDPKVHRAVLTTVTQFMVANGFTVEHVTHSPIKGGQGNIEFLAVLTRSETPTIAPSVDLTAILAATDAQLNHEVGDGTN